MRKFLFAGCGVMFLMVAAAIERDAAADDTKTPSVSDIMSRVNKGKTCLHRTVSDSIGKNEIDWAAVQKQTKEYSELAEQLGKHTPPKGAKSSWDKFTKGYAENAKGLNDAAQSKNKDEVLKFHGKITASCKACHNVHRES